MPVTKPIYDNLNLYSHADIEKMLGVGRMQIWNRRRDGKFPHPNVRHGRYVYWSKSIVNAWQRLAGVK